jgi:hypothetical protein
MNINFVRSTQFDVHSHLWICDDSCFNRRPNSGNSKLCRDSEQIVGLVCSVNSSRVGLKPTKCLVKVRHDTEDSLQHGYFYRWKPLYSIYKTSEATFETPNIHSVSALQTLVLLMGKFSEAIMHCRIITVYTSRHSALPWLHVNNEITTIV